MQKTATKETIEHYMNPEIKNTILRCCINVESEYVKWFVGDQTGWYYKRKGKNAAIPAISEGYDLQIQKFRTLHYTLAYYDYDLFTLNFSSADEKTEGKTKSKALVKAYAFGIDIDTVDQENGHGANIHEPAVKEAVESMASFFVSKLKEICPNSIYCLYSGGGIYVLIHHGVFEEYFKNYPEKLEEQKAIDTDILTDALNKVIMEWQNEFYTQFPQHKKYAKADAINGAKRVFKTIFSIHKKHPYAVIPLDKDNIKIDFEKAKYPLSQEVIKTGESWYTEYDKDNKFLAYLEPYLSKATEDNIRNIYAGESVLISETEHINFEEYPPCIQNILKMPSCGAGATRALAILAAFFGQIGVPHNTAKALWCELAQRWSAAALTTNVFESWYKKMSCPSCKTIMTPGEGYPSVDLANLGVCKPNSKCYLVKFSSPVYYTDKQLYIEKLKRDLLR